jgi:hypothetical protein
LREQHATLGIPELLRVVAENRCICRHLEYNQHPEKHLYLIAEKAGTAHGQER